MQQDVQSVQQWVQRESEVIDRLLAELRKVIVGQRYLLERLMIGLLADGHLLLEGVPGLAKTLSVSTMAAAVNGSFQRIQFTPDLLPADLTGTLVYNQMDGEFLPPPLSTAVFIPTSSPSTLISGPPEFPGFITVSV